MSVLEYGNSHQLPTAYFCPGASHAAKLNLSNESPEFRLPWKSGAGGRREWWQVQGGNPALLTDLSFSDTPPQTLSLLIEETEDCLAV